MEQMGFDQVQVLRLNSDSYDQLLQDYREEFQTPEASRDDLEMYFNVPIAISRNGLEFEVN